MTGSTSDTRPGIEPPPQPEKQAPALDAAALYRLMAWLSPAYPVGAFSYSGGLEWAIEAGDVTDAASLEGWLAVMIRDGGGFCDAVFLVHTHRAVTAGDDAALACLSSACPSSDNLRLIRHFEKGGSGSSGVRV